MRYLLTALLALSLAQLYAQGFGKNKPHYERFDFEVLESPNFEIYHYLNDSTAAELAAQSEQWYHLHQGVLGDTIVEKNPLIFYNDHPDFQQTNALSGSVGIGTGGVTEAFKNRVIMPLGMSNTQTNHVLGHELVHAFQYNMILGGDSTNIKNLRNLPLWMVEGLAEYLSIGRMDPHTAMWMRDAVLQDDVPTLKQLDSGKYFPYRWGQVFWTFVTGLRGDAIIEPYFRATAQYGLEVATRRTVGMELDQLSELWVKSIKKQYGPYVEGRADTLAGKVLFDARNAGKLNVAPVISPNGRYLIFLSEKDFLGIDLFLADARTGKVLRKVADITSSGHFDDFNYIETAGTWSPDSKRFAFVAVDKGDNVLVIKDVFSGKTLEQFPLADVPAFTNPVWHPDGKRIVVVGQRDGRTDLYEVRLRDRRVTQLTDDRAAELQPNFNLDGTHLVYATDALALQRGKTYGKWRYNLATRDWATGTTTQLDLFPGADNLNPVFDNADNIVFLSNRDGFRNLYRYEPATDSLFQLTDALTGISGITANAPALSVSHSERRNRFVYSYYREGQYRIYTARDRDFLRRPVAADAVDMTPGRLLQPNRRAPLAVDANFAEHAHVTPLPDSSLRSVAYQPKFKLDYVSGGGGVGVGTSNTFGTQTGAMGGIQALFGDMLGDHQLVAGASLNGEIFDFGANVTYINKKNRFYWGGSLSHTPIRTGRFGYAGIDTIGAGGAPLLVDHFVLDQVRIFQEQLGAFVQYPFSKTLRAELGGSVAFFHNRVDRFDNYYDAFGRLVAQERNKIDADASGLNLFGGGLQTVNAALIGDNSTMGLTAPLKGHRFRLSATQYFGDISFTDVTLDFRQYLRLKPVTFAVRAAHYGRYGRDANRFFPQFLGQPWFIRGYGFNQADNILQPNGRSINELFGSKLAVANAELRLPLAGPKGLTLIPNKFLFMDLNLFVDGGLAFSSLDQFRTAEGPSKTAPRPVFSAGVSTRVNLFGSLIVEPFYAVPLQPQTRGRFGVNLVPGW